MNGLYTLISFASNESHEHLLLNQKLHLNIKVLSTNNLHGCLNKRCYIYLGNYETGNFSSYWSIVDGSILSFSFDFFKIFINHLDQNLIFYPSQAAAQPRLRPAPPPPLWPVWTAPLRRARRVSSPSLSMARASAPAPSPGTTGPGAPPRWTRTTTTSQVRG